MAALLAEFPGRTPQAAPDDPPAADRQAAEAFSTGHKARLLRNLEEYFDEEELRSLCFELGVKYDSLPAQGTAGKARELVAALDRADRLHELVERGRQLRPHVPWGNATRRAGRRRGATQPPTGRSRRRASRHDRAAGQLRGSGGPRDAGDPRRGAGRGAAGAAERRAPRGQGDPDHPRGPA